MKIQSAKIGKLIARGGSCNVFGYGKNQVIKKSFVSQFLGKKYLQKIKDDYVICQKYFGDFVVSTQFFMVDNKQLEIQDFIAGEPLQIKHLTNKKIRLQFLDILTRLQKMNDEGFSSIDLIGIGGMLGKFSNVLVTEDELLKIIDTSLIESKTAGNAQFLAIPIMWLANKIQNQLIKKFLKESLAGL